MVASVRGLPRLLDGSAGRRPSQHFFFSHISANEHGQRAVKPWTGIPDGQDVPSAGLLPAARYNSREGCPGHWLRNRKATTARLANSWVLSQVALATGNALRAR